MKKSFAFLIATILVFSLFGCTANKTTDTKSNDAYCATKEPVYIGTNIEQYVADWQSAHNAKETDNGLYTTTYVDGKKSTITIPAIQTADFVLEELCVFEYSTYYLFMPTQGKPSVTSKIRMHILNEISYEACIEPTFKIFDNENMAYDAYRNTWYINDNKTISIWFPDNIKLTSPEQISDYFTFETYTAGDGNDHVVS